MSALALVVVGFVGMEAVSYATHRWVMHGVAYGWHRSHHQPRRGRLERNDRFPLVFASIGIGLFLLGRGPVPWMWWIAIGVTAYGAVYALVHDVFIHRRLPIRIPASSYLVWLREAHGDHHRRGGEPYGMLLPLVRDRRPSGRSSTQRPLDPRTVVALDDDERQVHQDPVREHRDGTDRRVPQQRERSDRHRPPVAPLGPSGLDREGLET